MIPAYHREECLTTVKDYGLLLKTLREAREMTQESAAEAVGVCVDTWYAYEANLRLPPMETVPRICAALEAPWLAWYFQEAHGGAGNVLPPAKAMRLSEAALTLIPRMRAFFTTAMDVRLMEIAADDQVDPEEEAIYRDIVDALRDLIGPELAVQMPIKNDRPEGAASKRSSSIADATKPNKSILSRRTAGVKSIQRGGAAL